MEIKTSTRVHCLFEQSGTFRDAFRSLVCDVILGVPSGGIVQPDLFN